MEKKENKMDDFKSTAISAMNKVSQSCDILSEKMVNSIRKAVPAVDECAVKDPAKLSNMILIINIAATVLMLFAFYALPTMPSIKGDGTLSLNQTLKLFSSIANAGAGSRMMDMPGLGFMLFVGRALFFVTFANLGVGLYTLFTNKIIPYVTNRLLSILAFVFMFILFIKVMDGGLYGVYIAMLASIFVGISGFAISSKS